MSKPTTPSYLIFAGDVYESLGGFKDIYGSAKTIEEAIELAREAVEIGENRPKTPEEQLPPVPPEMMDELAEAARTAVTTNDFTNLAKFHSTYRVYEPETHPCDWAQIVDLHTMKIVADVRNKTAPKEDPEEDPEEDYKKPKKIAIFNWH